MDFVNDVIAWKRDGHELDAARLHAFVDGVVDGSVPSYQASALLMAMVLRGLSDAETVELARAMVESGKTLDLRVVRRPVLDKHSSGGVGDKVTLVLAPLVAACGAVFGKMSGRGLGHTGGTLDKLESIPGFRVQLPQGEFVRQLERIGVAVVSQSERIVPADRILYALRDVTATIECDGLIAASIMAKKVASGTAALVLDIKVGRGAFMGDLDHARDLGRLCRLIGEAYERPTTCIFTSMEAPLGRTVGNRLEVEEAWQVLSGEGPDDVREVTLDAGRRPARSLGPRRRRSRGAQARRGGAGRRPRRRALRALVLRAGRPLEAGRVPPAGGARGPRAPRRLLDRGGRPGRRTGGADRGRRPAEDRRRRRSRGRRAARACRRRPRRGRRRAGGRLLAGSGAARAASEVLDRAFTVGDERPQARTARAGSNGGEGVTRGRAAPRCGGRAVTRWLLPAGARGACAAGCRARSRGAGP